MKDAPTVVSVLQDALQGQKGIDAHAFAIQYCNRRKLVVPESLLKPGKPASSTATTNKEDGFVEVVSRGAQK